MWQDLTLCPKSNYIVVSSGTETEGVIHPVELLSSNFIIGDITDMPISTLNFAT